MNDHILALEKVQSLVSLASKAGEILSGDYAACRVILMDLIAKTDEIEKLTHCHSYLTSARFHIDGMFGADIDNGHPFSQCASFAYSSLHLAITEFREQSG